ncbi:hypothetical protein MiAbB_04668 [Microcystis aeruginosa NIES-4285]|uniref:Uncharacterized protein n=1 Tax=Microcystis aeruginosa NIES-4285 TaxID=2497681 RepID=A0A402DKN5_MICAE|nr:hypothetical protein MiAbB_04668 [Microcystis aeruginosa NIES-4285]
MRSLVVQLNYKVVEDLLADLGYTLHGCNLHFLLKDNSIV